MEEEFVDLKELRKKLSNKISKDEKEFDPKKEMEKILENYREIFQQITTKLYNYEEIISLVILPPRPEEEYKNKVFLTAIIDDVNIKGEKLPKIKQLEEIITQTIEKNQNFFVTVKPLTLVWNEMNEGKQEIYYPIVGSFVLIDKKAVIEAIKIGFVLKDIVKKQFDNYLLTMYLFGSVTKGEARHDSDIDFAFLFDDTDLEGMSRISTKEHLHSILNKMANDAKLIANVNPNREIHIQVHLLTEFWKSIKEANPLTVNFLKEGVVFYDKGVFIPWKRLLAMGEIKPTSEAIDNYFRIAEELDNRIFNKLKEILMEDIFWAIITSTQAVLMALGYEPPYPKVLPSFIDNIREKEKVFDEEDVLFLEEIIKYRKGLEHGKIKELNGEIIDEMKEKAEKYFNKMKKLYRQVLLNYRRKEIKDLLENSKKLLKLIYNIEDFSLLKVLVKKGLLTYQLKDYLDLIEKVNETGEIREEEIEIIWKGLRILNKDLENKYNETLKRKTIKLMTKGFQKGKEVTIFFVTDGFYIIDEKGKAIKYYYSSEEVKESDINSAFEEVMKIAEKLEDIHVDVKKLAELGITLEF